jgi:hypothetical protein
MKPVDMAVSTPYGRHGQKDVITDGMVLAAVQKKAGGGRNSETAWASVAQRDQGAGVDHHDRRGRDHRDEGGL